MASLKDVSLKLTAALPDGATTSTVASTIDTGVTTAQGQTPPEVELLLTAPALTTGELPDAVTVTYNILTAANSTLSGNSTLISSAIVQTGSTGAAAATYRFRIPTTAARYIGFNAVGSGNGTRSGKSATLEVLA